MISLLPILCALGLMGSGAAHPATSFNKTITRGLSGHSSIVKTRGLGHGNSTAWPGADTTVDKRGTKWGKYVSYSGDKFMDESLWDYWTKDDPTHGKVK